MPTPSSGESRQEFIDRCVPLVLEDGTAEDSGQAVAICHSMFDRAKAQRLAGSHLKAIGYTADGELIVENHIVLFGGRDLVEEYFDQETDLESDYTKTVGRLPMDFEHGFRVDGDGSPGPDDILGYTDWSTAQKTDLGWLVRSVLDRRNKYVAAFEPLIEAGLMGTSSQAVLEGIEKDEDGRIARWPLKRNSLTVTPMEPRMLGGNILTAIKTLCELSPNFAKAIGPVLEATRKSQPTTAEETLSDESTLPDPIITIEENQPMGDQPTPQTEPDEVKGLRSDLAELGTRVDKILDYLESNPAAVKAGIVAPGGEGLAPQNKSFGDFLIAVRYGDMKRIKDVYKTRVDRKAFDAKDISGTGGSTAGVLVPEQYVQELLKVDTMVSPIVSMVRPVPVNTDHGKYPALDNYVTPTAGSGQTAAAAGIVVGNVAAGQDLPETTPGFKQVQWLISKVGGTVDVENEVMDDSPMAIETLLRDLFRIAIQSKNERNMFRGSGVGEPLGILNAPCVISVDVDSDNTFAYADALEMLSRFKSVTGRPAWFIHPSIWPDIGVFESSSGGGVWQANYQGVMGQTLLGFPIYPSEHLPQANNAGCVILADAAAYLLFQRSVLAVAYSEHAKFVADMGVWRFTQRNDGKPWLLNAITLADPQGSYTMSPFVYLND